MKLFFRQISVGLLVLSSLLVSVPVLASAQENINPNDGNGRPHMPGVFGTVSAINGSTITLQSKGRGPNENTTTPGITYTVNAANAVVIKNGATSTLSSVAVGDMVSAQGAVNGTTVTATKLRDGMGGGRDGMGRGQGQNGMMQGDGTPVIGGTITAVNGTSLTLTNRSNVEYTIDASHATVMKENSSSTIDAVAVGDRVFVRGTVNGNTVVASTVTDRGVPRAPETPQADGGNGNAQAPQAQDNGGGFFGSIRNFFHKFFGFF